MDIKNALIQGSPALLGLAAQIRGTNPNGLQMGLGQMQQAQERSQRKAAIGSLMDRMGISTPQRSILDTLPLEAQQQYLMQQMQPSAPDYRVVGSDLVKIGPDGVTTAHSAQKPQFSAPLSREKVKEMFGIDVSGPAQIGPDGRLHVQKDNGITVYNDEGNPIVTTGSAKPLKEAEGRNTGFFVRMRDSNQTLNELEAEGTSLSAKLKRNIPIAGNYLQSAEYQRYDQAKRDFINAVLRRESGAVIADSEFANAEVQYFPQPGDRPEVVEQKRKNRENAILGVEIGAGPGAADPRISGSEITSSPLPDISQISTEELKRMLGQ